HFYFLYRYAPYPDLHSFPTRRSSDLALMGYKKAILLPLRPPQEQTYPFGLCRALYAHTASASPILLVGMEYSYSSSPWGRVSSGDRKSTRLNSSHVKISYAVFCLKKK